MVMENERGKTYLDAMQGLVTSRSLNLTKNFTCILYLLIFAGNSTNLLAADLWGKTVEVYGTGGLGLRAWTNTCSDGYVLKADGTKGEVVSSTSSLCSSFNRWKIRWAGESVERWSAEDYLRVVIPDLTISGTVSLSSNVVAAGRQVMVSCVLTNVGEGRARDFGTTVQLYRTNPVQLVTSVAEIETFFVNSHNARMFSHILDIPSAAAPALYFVYVEVDAGNSTGQTNYANDVKKSVVFSVIASQFTVAATSGSGGSVSPSGNQSVAAFGGVTFTAFPDAAFMVDSWTVNGVLSQSGGTSFTQNNVVSNSSVVVTFKQIPYSLSVASTLNGVEWNGPIVFKIQGPETLDGNATPFAVDNRPSGDYRVSYVSDGPANAYLSRVEAAPASIAQSASPKSNPVAILLRFFLRFISHSPTQVPVPDPNGYVVRQVGQPQGGYRLEHKRIVTENWRFLQASISENSLVAFRDTEMNRNAEGYYRIVPERSDSEALFRFPLLGFTPYTVTIASIFDHDVAKPAPGDALDHGCSNGIIVAYTGETGSFSGDLSRRSVWSHGGESMGCYDETLYGFKNNENAAFRINSHYNGGGSTSVDGVNTPKFLFYDGHTGYDYPAPANTEVIAAADGTVSSGSYSDDGVEISHPDGYKTYYLHLKNRIATGTTIVGGKTVIGKVLLDHLHFTVKLNGRRLDPYGWEGPPNQDPWKINGQDNKNLWKDFKTTDVNQ